MGHGCPTTPLENSKKEGKFVQFLFIGHRHCFLDYWCVKQLMMLECAFRITGIPVILDLGCMSDTIINCMVGFDSFFFAQMYYHDKAKRIIEKTLKVIWHGSRYLGSSSQDDVLLFDYNVQEHVIDFVAATMARLM